MPAFTPNLNLYKPGGGSTGTILPDEVVDIDRINQNSDIIDGAVKALQDRATSLETQAGLTLLKPGAVSGGTVSSSGEILVSNGTTVSINDAFTTKYKNYRVVLAAVFANDQSIQIRLRKSGVDEAGAGVYRYGLVASSGSGTSGAEGAASSWPIQNGAFRWVGYSMDILNPATVDLTLATWLATVTPAAGTYARVLSGAGLHGSGDTYDGLSFIPTASWTGSIKIYGYN